jgi:hypothetical protein
MQGVARFLTGFTGSTGWAQKTQKCKRRVIELDPVNPVDPVKNSHRFLQPLCYSCPSWFQSFLCALAPLREELFAFYTFV